MGFDFVLDSQCKRVDGWTDPMSKVIMVAAVAARIWQVERFKQVNGTA